MSSNGRPITHAARAAAGGGYFSPDSMLRRIGRSPLVYVLGAGPAVLFQVAHPLVAASVVDHTDYEVDLWWRWRRNFHALYLITFGSRAEADAVVEVVHTAHGRVRGTTSTQLGPFPPGTPYAATDPPLLLWVNAALTEVALGVYSGLVRKLTPDEEERFYRDMAVVVRLFGVPVADIPPTLGDFREYVQSQLAEPEIRVTPPARDIARAVLYGPLPVAIRWLAPAHRLSTAGMLPPRLRDEYGLAWGPARALALAAAASSFRTVAAPLVFAAERAPQPAAPFLAARP